MAVVATADVATWLAAGFVRTLVLVVRVDRSIWKDERNMLAPIEKAAPTSIAGAALFLLHAALNQPAPHGLAATALDPIRAGGY
jgi:hypothetical protein